MLTLHYSPDSASLIIRLVLEESGLTWRAVAIARAEGALDSAAYRALIPTGRIPVLETPDGPVFETGAILLWLSEQVPGLLPMPGDPARGAALSWLFFIANTLHPDLMHLFYPERFTPPEGADGHRALMIGRLKEHLALLDEAARTRPALFAPPALLAPYVAVLWRWLQQSGDWLEPSACPALQALALELEARPATQAASAAEGLGTTPFSAPNR